MNRTLVNHKICVKSENPNLNLQNRKLQASSKFQCEIHQFEPSIEHPLYHLVTLRQLGYLKGFKRLKRFFKV